MPALDENRAAADANDEAVVAERPRCTCLPFCFWRGSRRTESRRGEDAPGKRRRRRRIRLRLSWLAFSWPWLRRSGEKNAGGGDFMKKTGKQRRGRRLLLLLKTSLQVKKALASVVSGDSSGLLPAVKAASFGGDAKKQNRSKPGPTADGTTSNSTRQPQGSTTAMGTNHPCPTTTTDEPVLAGRIWRAPSRRHSLQQPHRADAERPGGASGLWTAATTLGVIVLFGRVTAVVFLCSCLYGVRFVWARPGGATSASAKSSGVAGASSSRRFRDPTGGTSRRFVEPIGVAAEKGAESCATKEFKKKVAAERAGKWPSSRFGR